MPFCGRAFFMLVGDCFGMNNVGEEREGLGFC